MSVYDINGTAIVADIDPSIIVEKNLNYDATVKSVNHRGYSIEAPENTLPAYVLSKKMGFNFVETDVSFTSDGVAMLLHDATINRTSNGAGTLSEMTYEQVRQYDFGSWKNAKYAGTKIPTLDEFLNLCKAIMLHPYIELKPGGGYTQAQVESIVDAVNAHGLKGKVTYISFLSVYLGYVKDYDPEARLGYLKGSVSDSDIITCKGLMTGKNEVFFDVSYDVLTQSVCGDFAAENIPIETWTVNSESIMLGLNNYVSGITSDSLIAGKVLYDNVMNEN